MNDLRLCNRPPWYDVMIKKEPKLQKQQQNEDGWVFFYQICVICKFIMDWIFLNCMFSNLAKPKLLLIFIYLPVMI